MRLGLSRTRNRNLKGVGIFFTLFFLIFLIWLIFTKLQPFFIEYAKVYSNNIANEVVNSAVDDVFVKEEYQSLAKIMENSSENIKAIETDTAKVNRLKSAIIQSMQKNIDSHKAIRYMYRSEAAVIYIFLPDSVLKCRYEYIRSVL